IAFGGSGASRTVTVTPAADRSGSATITVTVSDGSASAGDTFVLTVTAVNDAPTVSDIADQTTAEDTATAALGFTVGDVETPAADLVLSASSSDPDLVADIAFGGSGASRTVTVTPAADRSGSATITVTVSDGSASAGDTFVLTVTAVDDVPTAMPDTATTAEENPVDVDVVTNDTGLGDGGITVVVLGTSNGSATVGSDNTVTFTPALDFVGTAGFSYRVSDLDGDSSAGTASITVTAVNDGPTISDIADQTTNEDTATAAVGFTVGDVETGAADLTVSASSSDTALVPVANIAFGGSGANRTVTVTPAADRSGSATITVTVSDGSASAGDTFVLTVTAVNDAPVANDDDVSTEPATPVSFNVLDNDVDVDDARAQLTITVTSSPVSGTLSCAADGGCTYTPTAGTTGSTDSFTYTVRDQAGATSSAKVTITLR
ncbi:MAG: cadherin-like domain-containing protein, partial [Actinomycetota bacterium]|nr:cadherin-like domain-containing protein [Actinomycetota bacterium]